MKVDRTACTTLCSICIISIMVKRGDKVSENMSNELVYLDSGNANEFSLATEFTVAQYSLTKNELKTWLLLIASLDEFRDNDPSGTVYCLNANTFADRLKIDVRKARGKIVAGYFIQLSHKYIDIRSREDQNGDQDIYHAPFIAETKYNKQTHMLHVALPPTLNNYLFKLPTGTYIRYDIDTILQLDSVNAMRIFLYLRGLELNHIHQVSIEEYRKEMHISPETQWRYYRYKTLAKVVEEIRRHTEYKDFYIEDNAKRGQSATILYFGFHKKGHEDDYLVGVAPAIAKDIKEHYTAPEVLLCLNFAIEKGFDPRYLSKIYDTVDEQSLVANLNYVRRLILKEQMEGQYKAPEVYGKYFYKAIMEDWAGKAGQKQEQVSRAKNAVLSRQQEKLQTIQQEREELQNNMLEWQKMAEDYVKEMSLKELADFISSHQVQLDNLAGKRPFNTDHAMTRKRNYREFRFIKQIVLGKMMSGEIPIHQRNISLFS